MFEGFKEVPYGVAPAIYMLIQGAEVVYVGRSRRGLARPYEHEAKGWEFDRVFIRYCKRGEDPGRIEHEMIVKYRPRYNVDYTPRWEGVYVPLMDMINKVRRL
jgi:hypothetical protein